MELTRENLEKVTRIKLDVLGLEDSLQDVFIEGVLWAYDIIKKEKSWRREALKPTKKDKYILDFETLVEESDQWLVETPKKEPTK